MKQQFIIVKKPQDWEILQYSPMPPEYPIQDVGPIQGHKKHGSILDAIQFATTKVNSINAKGIERPWHVDFCILRSCGKNCWTFLKIKDFDLVCDLIRYPDQLKDMMASKDAPPSSDKNVEEAKNAKK